MKLKTNFFAIVACVILVTSTFTVAGGLLSSPDESEIVLVSLDGENDLSRMEYAGVEILEVYPDRALVDLPRQSEERLDSMGIEIANRLPSRTQISVKGHEFDIEEGTPEFSDELTIDGYEEGEKGLYLVHTIGPMHSSWREEFEYLDAEIMDYAPNYAYEMYMTPETSREVEELDFVNVVDIYQPGFKLAHDLEPGEVTINLADGSQLRTEIEDRSALIELARRNDVYYISNYIEPELHGEVSSQTIGGGHWIWDPDDDPYVPWRGHNDEYDYGTHVNQLGYGGEGVTVAVADTGIIDHHPDFQDRFVGGMSYATGEDWNEDGSGHGTHVAGSVAGNTYEGTGDSVDDHWDTEVEDYYVGQGMAPQSELFGQKIFNNNEQSVIPSDISELIIEARSQGDAYIHANSWGSPAGGAYQNSCSQYDSVVRDAGDGEPMVITTSAGNDGEDARGGPAYQSTGSPANGKNVITVGASEAFYPGLAEGNEDFEGDPDRTAQFSSRGWAEDGRVKPDIMAPGMYTFSTYIDEGDPDGWGYAGMGGTSMSNPAVAGAAALVTEWYEDQYGVRPSPAMVKALMINTAYDMEDRDEDFYTGPIPNRDEGWGMVNLPMFMDASVDLMLEDQTTVLDSQEEHRYEVEYQDADEPFKVSLVWTDAPASGGADPSLRNDLNLEVETPGGDRIHGNAFDLSGDGASDDGYTYPDAEVLSNFDGNDDGWDDRNNVQNVFIPPENLEEGDYTITVRAENVPEPVVDGGQDYALVVYNEGEQEPGPLPPEDPSPEDGATSINLNATLSVDVQHEVGEPMDVSFHDASDHTLIGIDEGVENDTRASIEWDGLEQETSYEWYAEADDGVQTAGSNIWSFTTREAGPVSPEDPSPEDGATEVGTDPELSVYVEHEADDTSDVSFYDASDDSVIGTVEDVASGEIATTTWSDLELRTTYNWYAVSDDGEQTTESDEWSFTTEGYMLTLDVAGEGTIDPEEGSHIYEPEEDVTVLADPSEGWHFDGWTGDHQDTQEETTITMNADKEITANFEINVYGLTVDIVGEGSTDPSEGDHSYEHGEEVTITANPSEGWYFEEWTGDHTGMEEEITLTMDEDMAITANFEPHEYDLTIDIQGGGITNPAQGTHTYGYGEEVTIEASPNEGWYFEEWTGDHTGTEEEITIEMDEDKSVTAHFAIYEYELDLSVVGEGSIEIDPEQEVYEHGMDVELTATSDEEWYLEEWTGDVQGTEDEISVTMDEDKEITAHFAIYEYELDLSVVGEGTVEIDPEQEVYEHGTEVELVAVPEEDWYFDGWTGDTSGIDEEITLTMDESMVITANFEMYDPAYFEVEIIDYTEEAKEGGEVSIEYQVENTGELEGTQDIVLTLGGEEITSHTDITLGPGEEFKDEFIVDAEDTGEQDFGVSSSDTTDEVMMTIEDDGFLSNYWWLIVVLLIAIIAVAVLIFVIGIHDDEEEEDDDETARPAYFDETYGPPTQETTGEEIPEEETPEEETPPSPPEETYNHPADE